MKYRHGEKILEVLPGLGGCWIVGWRTDLVVTHRVPSEHLPTRWSREDAQRDLDAWAKRKGLEEVRRQTGRHEGGCGFPAGSDVAIRTLP
jgi:hypothetical protein